MMKAIVCPCCSAHIPVDEKLISALTRKTDPLPVKRRVYTPEEVRTILGMSESKVTQLYKSGVLKSVKIGRSVRIPVEALDTFLESHGSGRGAVGGR